MFFFSVLYKLARSYVTLAPRPLANYVTLEPRPLAN